MLFVSAHLHFYIACQHRCNFTVKFFVHILADKYADVRYDNIITLLSIEVQCVKVSIYVCDEKPNRKYSGQKMTKRFHCVVQVYASWL